MIVLVVDGVAPYGRPPGARTSSGAVALAAVPSAGNGVPPSATPAGANAIVTTLAEAVGASTCVLPATAANVIVVVGFFGDPLTAIATPRRPAPSTRRFGSSVEAMPVNASVTSSAIGSLVRLKCRADAPRIVTTVTRFSERTSSAEICGSRTVVVPTTTGSTASARARVMNGRYADPARTYGANGAVAAIPPAV